MSGTTVTTELDVELAKFLQKYAKADERVTQSAEHTIRESKRANRGVDQGVGAYGAKGFPLPASVAGARGVGSGLNSFGLFESMKGQSAAAGAEAGAGISAGMAAGIGGAAAAVVSAFAAVLKQLLGIAEEAAVDLAKTIYHGLEFNYQLDNASVGISNVIGQFQDLNSEASKDAAAAALARIVELEPKTAGTMTDLVQGFMATIGASQSAGLSINENITLVSKFANAVSNIGMPTWQLPQELRSILSGNITKDSMVAKVLQITNEDVAKWKAAGTLFEELEKKVGKIGDAGDSAQVALTSLRSVIDQSLGSMTKPLFDELVVGGKVLTEMLKSDVVKQQLANISASVMELWGSIKEMAPDLMLLGVNLLGLVDTALKVANAFAPLVRAMVLLGAATADTINKAFGRIGNAHMSAPKVVVENPVLDRHLPFEHEKTAEQTKVENERATKLESIASLEEKIGKLRRDSLQPGQKLQALEDDRLKLLEKFNTMGGLPYQPNEQGMADAAKAYQSVGRLDEAKKLLELQERYLELLKEQSTISKGLVHDAAAEAEKKAAQAAEQAKKEAETAKKIHGKELGLMTPKEQAKALMEDLSKSFGFDVHNATDIQKGLADKKKAWEDEKDPERKARAATDYESALDAASRLEQAGGQRHPRSAMAGEAANAISTIMGGSGQLVQVDEAKKTNSGIEKMVRALDRLVKAAEGNGESNPFDGMGSLFGS